MLCKAQGCSPTTAAFFVVFACLRHLAPPFSSVLPVSQIPCSIAHKHGIPQRSGPHDSCEFTRMIYETGSNVYGNVTLAMFEGPLVTPEASTLSTM
jgi:hypothetical protein